MLKLTQVKKKHTKKRNVKLCIDKDDILYITHQSIKPGMIWHSWAAQITKVNVAVLAPKLECPG